MFVEQYSFARWKPFITFYISVFICIYNKCDLQIYSSSYHIEICIMDVEQEKLNTIHLCD
jgi:hypothetical protein